MTQQMLLQELKHEKMKERLDQTEKLRHKVLEKIRMKNNNELKDASPDSSLQRPQDKQDREWWNGIKHQINIENQDVNRDIFKETQMEFRKAERLKDRIKNRYESYWDQYNTSRNYNAKSYSNIAANDYYIPKKQSFHSVNRKPIK